MLEKGGCFPAPSEAIKAEPSTSLDSTLTTTGKNKKNKNKNKRRFSDEQIRSMETMFESESKLEPRTKLQLARELDLQPRQVAIWFQNKRARWKSKQLEREYDLLKANYDALASQFESMKKEQEMLHIQLQKLTEKRGGMPRIETRSCPLASDGNSTERDPDNRVIKSEHEQKPAISFEGSDLRAAPCSDDENNNNYYLGENEEADLMNVMDPASSILASPGNWSAFNSDNGLFDQSSSTSQWWEFWA